LSQIISLIFLINESLIFSCSLFHHSELSLSLSFSRYFLRWFSFEHPFKSTVLTPAPEATAADRSDDRKDGPEGLGLVAQMNCSFHVLGHEESSSECLVIGVQYSFFEVDEPDLGQVQLHERVEQTNV
jgi:hypothetical protein